MPAKPTPLPEAEVRQLAELGERLRLARLRRGQTAAAVAARAGITRVTLTRLERGEAGVTVGTLIKVMGALGLADDFECLARDTGQALATERLAPRRVPPCIRLAHYPQLQSVAWHVAEGPAAVLTPAEAFTLYERNWRHIEPAKMLPRELALLERLTATVGKGVLLV